MSETAPDRRQFSPLGLKLVAAASLAGILVLVFPAGLTLIKSGMKGTSDTPNALAPVSCAAMLCIPLFLSLRALKRGALSEEDGNRLLVFIVPLTVLAVGVAAMTVIIGGLLVAETFL